MTNPAQPSAAALSPDETVRYGRHLSLPDVGIEGQLRLKCASVLLIGAGGLGSPLALYLAAAGIGRIGIVDFDRVDLSNLQRQILHGTADVGRPKLASARNSIAAINPHVQVDGYETRLSSDNALEILKPYDVIVDGTDNFPTRYLLNDACVFLKKPLVYGSIFRFEGQSTVFHAGHGPCYRCLYPEPPPPGLVPDCAEGGVLGVLPGIIGTIQATEAIKLILGRGDSLLGRLLLYDALRMKFRELKITRDPKCPVCGDHPTITKLIDYETFCGVRSANAKEGTQPMNDPDRISATALKAELDGGTKIMLLDVRELHEFNIAHLPDCQHVPLNMLDLQLDEFDRNANIVAYCRSGVRSQRAAKLLRDRGFKHVRDLEGGILAWAEQIDPTMPKY